MSRRVLLAAVPIALAVTVRLPAQAPTAPAAPQTALVKAGRLVDARAGAVLTNQAILIEGERIKELGPAGTVACSPSKRRLSTTMAGRAARVCAASGTAATPPNSNRMSRRMRTRII